MGVELRTSHVSRSKISSSFLQTVHTQFAIKQHLHHRSTIKFCLLHNKVSVSDKIAAAMGFNKTNLSTDSDNIWFRAIYPFCESKHCDHNQIRLLQVTRDTKLEDYSECWCRVLVFFWFLSFGDMSFSFSRMSLTRDSISRMSLTRKERMGYRHLFFLLLSVDCLLVILWLVQGYEDIVSLVWTRAFLVCDCLISMQIGIMTFWVEHIPWLS